MDREMTKIWTVDAFTSEAYAGNPAAVMIVPDFPKNAQQIASEMNLSETVFVKMLGDNHAHIRWLTPTVEVPLCGHDISIGLLVQFCIFG